MKRIVAALAFSALLVPTVASADPTSAAINTLSIEQAIDCVTTLAVLHSGGYERDPIAAPFTHSAFSEFAAAAVVNVAARRLPVRILHTVISVYPFIILGNVRAMGATGDTAGMVPGAPTAALPVRPRPHR
jgi:hypothetical protein